MGFFGKLFKRKAGGTRVGNILRSLAYEYSGGLIGEDRGGVAEILLYGSADAHKQHNANKNLDNFSDTR